MTTPLRLALAAAGSAALYKLAETLAGSRSPFSQPYYDTPLFAIAAVAVVLFLALGVFDAARNWNPGWRRIAVIGAVVLAVAALPNWFSHGWRPAEAVWRVATFLAVPAAALTVWSWFRWGPARGGDDARFTLGTVADALTRHRVPLALVFGAVVPLALFTGYRPDLWTDPANAPLALVLAAVSTVVLLALPGALVALTSMELGRRRAILLSVGVLSAAFAVYAGLDAETVSGAGPFTLALVMWASAMVSALLVTLVSLVSRVGGWAGEGFAASDAVGPPRAPDEGRMGVEEPAGAVARRRVTRARRR